MVNLNIPDVNVSPTLGTYTGQGAFRFWCQKVLPLVYDDSLSYYELLNKVVVYLNNVITDMSAVEGNMTAVADSFDELEDYVNRTKKTLVDSFNELNEFVNDYFTNLDVQNEINEKLDEMASDGTLTALISPIIDAEVPEAVSAWLEENVTPTEPIVDASLSIRGAAADAQATGNAIESCKYVNTVLSWKGNNAYPYGWKTGYYSGEIGSSYEHNGSYNYLCAHFAISVANYPEIINCEKIRISPPSGYGIKVIEIDAEDIITNIYGEINTTSYPDVAGKTIEFNYTTNRRWLVSIGRFNGDSNEYMTSEFSESIKFDVFHSNIDKTLTMSGLAADAKKTGEEINNINEIINEMKNLSYTLNWKKSDTYPVGFRTGYYTGEAGEEYGTSNSNNYIRAQFAISIENYPIMNEAEKFIITPNDNFAVAILEIDENNIIISKKGAINTNTYPERKGVPVEYPINNEYRYLVEIGRSDGMASNLLNDDFISTNILTFVMKKKEKIYKPKTGEYEFFDVEVERPMAFGGNDVNTTSMTVESVLRLPDNYKIYGEKTQLILMCHGASGYIDKTTETWYNSYWKTFCNEMLNAGYALFDVNVLPNSVGDKCGYCAGSPLAVNVAKKAYDYIIENYNIKEKILVHGTSMGGVLASAFVNAYPNLVIAQSSFAGRDLSQYIKEISDGTLENGNDFAMSYGYSNLAALNADKFSHAEGLVPSLSLKKYNNGSTQLPPVREENYSDWLNYYAEIQRHTKDEVIGNYTAFRSVPYKSWNSWNDNINKTKAELILQKAYNAGCSSPYFCVVYEYATHTELSYGQVDGMIEELIAWFKRWA